MEETCCKCRYFKDDRCHRYPPVAAVDVHTGEEYHGVESDIYYRHPKVAADNWCGEFKSLPLPLSTELVTTKAG